MYTPSLIGPSFFGVESVAVAGVAGAAEGDAVTAGEGRLGADAGAATGADRDVVATTVATESIAGDAGTAAAGAESTTKGDGETTLVSATTTGDGTATAAGFGGRLSNSEAGSPSAEAAVSGVGTDSKRRTLSAATTAARGLGCACRPIAASRSSAADCVRAYPAAYTARTAAEPSPTRFERPFRGPLLRAFGSGGLVFSSELSELTVLDAGLNTHNAWRRSSAEPLIREGFHPGAPFDRVLLPLAT